MNENVTMGDKEAFEKWWSDHLQTNGADMTAVVKSLFYMVWVAARQDARKRRGIK